MPVRNVPLPSKYSPQVVRMTATVLEQAKNLLILGFLSLPLMLIAFTMIMGFGLGNVGMILLFLGQITVVPIATFLSNGIFGFIKSKLG